MSVIKRPTSPNWYTNFIFAGRPVRRSTGTCDREKAQEYEDRLKARMWEQQRLGVKPKRLWQEAVIDYLEQMPDSANKRNTAYALRWLNAQLNGKALQDITRGTLADLQKKLLRAGNKPATVNRKLSIVIAVLRKAEAWEWIDRAPKIEDLDEGPKRLRYISREQAVTLLKELPLHLRMMAVFALETGLRRANVTHLKWEYVDLDRGFVTIPAEVVKGQTRAITLPLSGMAHRLLDSLRSESCTFTSKLHPNSGPVTVQPAVRDSRISSTPSNVYAEANNPGIYVFTYRGRPVEQTATRAWRKALARAGITDFRWHDLRHTWASWHAQDGTPERMLQDLGGWKDQKMVVHYAHLAASHLAPYVERRQALSGDVLHLLSDKSSDSAQTATPAAGSKSLIQKQSGNSSVGRAQPCQGDRRNAGSDESKT